jgi:hypothetical protein
MRAYLLLGIILIGLAGCEAGVKTRQIFYGTTLPPVVSITVGDVENVKSMRKKPFSSPSIIAPNRIATVKTAFVLTGEGVGERLGLAFESGRSNEPVANQRYVFFWDKNGVCVQYFTTRGDFYIKDDLDVPLSELKNR